MFSTFIHIVDLTVLSLYLSREHFVFGGLGIMCSHNVQAKKIGRDVAALSAFDNPAEYFSSREWIAASGLTYT